MTAQGKVDIISLAHPEGTELDPVGLVRVYIMFQTPLALAVAALV
jgi:hypothetical protein